VCVSFFGSLVVVVVVCLFFMYFKLYISVSPLFFVINNKLSFKILNFNKKDVAHSGSFHSLKL
jgi:hypothetical protein